MPQMAFRFSFAGPPRMLTACSFLNSLAVRSLITIRHGLAPLLHRRESTVKGWTVQLLRVSVAGSNNMGLRWKCDSFAMWQAMAA